MTLPFSYSAVIFEDAIEGRDEARTSYFDGWRLEVLSSTENKPYIASR